MSPKDAKAAAAEDMTKYMVDEGMRNSDLADGAGL